jgi:hypothetical protein
VSWDFVSYIANAKYLFYEGSYFEVYRAPIVSLILAIFLWMGKIAEYLFIIIVSLIHLYSIIQLSDSLYDKYLFRYKLKKETVRFLFYLFSLSPFVLSYGLSIGTELLALSFFQLFLANFIEDKNSGAYLALAVLTRYNFLLFFPFLFFNKKIKKILLNLGSFLIVLFPWFLFNFLKFGNWFTSIVDSYFLNIVSRQDAVQPFNFSALLYVISWLLPFLIIGLGFFLSNLIKEKKKVLDFRYEFLFLIISLLFLWDFYHTPFKIARYTFNLSLPIAFFCVLGAIYLLKKMKTKEFRQSILLILLLFSIIISLFVLAFYYNQRGIDDIYRDAAEDLKELNLQGCKTLSPHWVPINYYLEQSSLLTYDIGIAIYNKEIVVIFQNYPTMDDEYDIERLESYNQLKNTEDYIIFGKENITSDDCKKWQGFDSSMISDQCIVISSMFKNIGLDKFASKMCNLVNFEND